MWTGQVQQTVIVSRRTLAVMEKGSRLNGKNIVIGITASIAAYKCLAIIKDLVNLGANIHVILTEHAMHLVDCREFEEATGNTVHTKLFLKDIDYRGYLVKNKRIKHVSLSNIADLLLICPSTANVLAKVAHGIADDLLTSTVLATDASVVFAPAMNVKMWKKHVTQDNIAVLKSRGIFVIDPDYGDLACGYKGMGRLANCNRIVSEIRHILKSRNILAGKKVVITAGAIYEPIDAVRVLSNRASGKMGAALADAAFLYGALVVYIKGENSVSPRYFMKEISVKTNDDLLIELKKELLDADIFIHSAAVSDFVPQKRIMNKVKSNKSWQLNLEPMDKIIDQVKTINSRIYLVGFKAGYKLSRSALIRSAKEVLERSCSDMIIANDVGEPGRGFGTDTNEVYIVEKTGTVTHFPFDTKLNIASSIIGLITQLYK